MSNNILDNYEDILLDLLSNNKDAKVGLAEFGRGDGSLYNYLKDKVAEVHVIEDWNQTIFQADRNNYNDCENLIEYNVLSTYELQEKFDVYHNKTNQRLFFKNITLMGGIFQVNALGNGDDLSIKPIIESPTYWENLCRYFYK